jgi:hypothetical protein
MIRKPFVLSLILVLFFQFAADAQVIDTNLIKKLSINGICLCNITLAIVSKTGGQLKKVEVEEMDLGKSCIGQDSRFIAGVGYSSLKYPGMIFQQDQGSDQISKIRLNRQFKGKLPDGKFVDMDKLLLKDLLKMYPKLKDTWGSRGCSDYWNFSNDTLSFYVKIDKNKKPQFPADEKYYADKPVEAADLTISCYSFGTEKSDNLILADDPNSPVYFLDSIRVNEGVLKNYKPEEFASVTVYKDANAVRIAGPAGKNGVVYFETKEFAKKIYWNYLKSKSPEYGRLVATPKNEDFVQYILNGKVLTDNYEADLAAINDKTFKSITIIDHNRLTKDYGVTNKRYGIVVVANILNRQK